MEPFKTHTGIVAVLNRGNVDTDQIISKEHLKSIKRTGYGSSLFSDWRYDENGKPNPGFELNESAYNGSTILVAGNNFGCGSSREHAVWAIVQYGFRTVIAPQRKSGSTVIPGFADIFRNNSTKNGLLLIELSEDQVNEIVAGFEANKGAKATIDLAAQKITTHLPTGDKQYPFSVDSGVKHKFLEGLDDIGQTEKLTDKITSFEKSHSPQLYH